MAEEILVLMADLDEESQRIMGGWYGKLHEKGFTGVQTPNLPFHITLASFALDKEQEVVKEMEELAKRFSEIPVHLSHIGMFAGGKVLFAGPDMNPAELLNLRKAIKTEKQERFSWTPHSTILIDDADKIQKALPFLIEDFQPFMGKITRLHLCAFWPTREVAAVYLNNSQ